jgi:hypothetical protein
MYILYELRTLFARRLVLFLLSIPFVQEVDHLEHVSINEMIKKIQASSMAPHYVTRTVNVRSWDHSKGVRLPQTL